MWLWNNHDANMTGFGGTWSYRRFLLQSARPRSPTVAPSWSFTASSNGLPGSHFSSPTRPSQSVPWPPGQRTLLVSPRYFRPDASSAGCSCTRPRLGGSRGRRPTDHHTWTAKVNNSLTRLVTTSALPRRRVTCARHCGLPQSSCFRIILGLVITAAALLSRQCPRWASWVAAADTR